MTKGQMSQNVSSFEKVCACPQKTTTFFPGSVVRINSIKEQGGKKKKKGRRKANYTF